MSTSQIVAAQDRVWFVFLLLPSFVIYLISMVGETNRAPFDLPEAEGELVAGFHTEYSSLKFAMFMLAEYGNLTAASCIATILFFGGWIGPAFGPEWLRMVLPTVWFVVKIAIFIFIYVLARSTVPRIRYDQLMRFGWKYLLPISFANIVVTSFLVAIS